MPDEPHPDLHPVLRLGHVSSYPEALLDVVRQEIEVFRAWEFDLPGKAAKSYDQSMDRLCDVLQSYQVRGWHCTKLTPEEILEVRSNGLRVLSLALAEQKVDALVRAGRLTPSWRDALLQESRASDENRRGMVWFCFFKPRYAGESGISRLLSHWGGEALYWAFEDDAEIGPVLREIGIPAVVEADVPVSDLRSADRVATSVVRSYLKSLGENVVEPIATEHYAVRDLSSDCIKRIYEFPSVEFARITGCNSWRTVLLASG